MRNTGTEGRTRPSMYSVAVVFGAATLLLGLAGPATALTSDEPRDGRRVTPERYVREVCSALSDWIQTTYVADEGLFETVEALDRGGDSSAGKQDAIDFAEDAVAATDDLIETTREIGTPGFAGGSAVARDHLAVLRDVRDEYDSLRAAMTAMSVDDPVAMTDVLETRTVEAMDAFVVIGNPLETLQANSRLRSIVDDVGECAGVFSAYAVNAESLGFGVGDCVDNYAVVDCSMAHEYEVYLVVDHPAHEGKPYPGNRAITRYADKTCRPAFEDYVGVPYEDSIYDYQWLAPDDEFWKAGDREVICGVGDPTGTKLTGVVRGSAR
jgi:hypothetical protein